MRVMKSGSQIRSEPNQTIFVYKTHSSTKCSFFNSKVHQYICFNYQKDATRPTNATDSKNQNLTDDLLSVLLVRYIFIIIHEVIDILFSTDNIHIGNIESLIMYVYQMMI